MFTPTVPNDIQAVRALIYAPDVHASGPSQRRFFSQVGGLITGELQSPLCHVALLCQNRNTPSFACRNWRQQWCIAGNEGKLVRVVVGQNSFSIVRIDCFRLATLQKQRKAAQVCVLLSHHSCSHSSESLLDWECVCCLRR